MNDSAAIVAPTVRKLEPERFQEETHAVTVRHLLGLAGLALALAGSASASVITQDTRNDGGSAPGSASAFLSSFNALASGGSGYGVTTNIATWTGLNNLYGARSNLATAMTAQFSVAAALAGSWSFEVGGDGGLGGALFLDGRLIGSLMTNFDIDPAVTATNITVSAGTHTLTWITYEDCCDGPQNAGRFKTPGAASYTTFAAADGLTAVPEPGSFAILMLGVFSLVGIEALRAARAGSA